MPRLVRRQPLIERIKSYLNPLDFLLWLSEELESGDWDEWQKEYGTISGCLLNLVMLIARANSGSRRNDDIDDVFGDEDDDAGWMSWLCSFIVHFLTLFSLLNAFYTFYRKRHYRLFETPIDEAPHTPSAQRVRVDSSPSSSPFRYITNVINSTTAAARAHPDSDREVWELAVWDPTRLCLHMFCMFSPGHILVYFLFLPTSPLDPRPSVTIVKTLILVTLLSIQLTLLKSSFIQQTKDADLIHKEVLHEYNAKFVHPRTQTQMRDVGTQFFTDLHSPSGLPSRTHDSKFNRVQASTPVTIINKGFQTHANPSYSRHVDPNGLATPRTAPRPIYTPAAGSSYQTPSGSSSPIKHQPQAQPQTQPLSSYRPSRSKTPSHTHSYYQPQFQPPKPNTASRNGDGGSLGVYSHANSPLRKSRSTGIDGLRDRAIPNPFQREGGSPLKRSSVVGAGGGEYEDSRRYRKSGMF
ncbi:MAG: hypothetical protein M1834_003996 [Cirrosporium novae-zelandiae]|nr:MAG: hypothetical protein M1834_003996 [Cirrosporium novae-zelandiae]